MKKYILVLILLLSIWLLLAFKFPVENSFPLFGKFIILDPGHGFLDPGSIYQDEYEKDYNLTFSKTLKSVLEEKGATVIMTREGDYDLSSPNTESRKRSDFNNRIKLINENKPDVYLSLHMNSLSDTKYFGAQAFYSDKNEKNEHLAKIAQKNFNEYFNFDKDYKKIGLNKYMFSKIEVPGILIEYGFISNYKDRQNLKKEEYRKELSEVISASLIEYFT